MEPTNLNKELLLKIMERSYKLSWINYEETTRGCLPTIAYELKLQLEAELSNMVQVALDEMIASYEEWLSAYEEYVTRLNVIIEDLPDTLYYARINEVQKLISLLRTFRSRDALLDKINALQLGVLNAYHDRSLANFLDMPASAEAFLEQLFTEPFIEAWDKEVSEVIFREPGSVMSEKRVFLNAGTVSYSDLFLTLAMVASLEKTAMIKKLRKEDVDPDRLASEQVYGVYSADGSKLLGRHPTEESAKKQLAVIEMHKHGK